jgi:hypothetical protein
VKVVEIGVVVLAVWFGGNNGSKNLATPNETIGGGYLPNKYGSSIST